MCRLADSTRYMYILDLPALCSITQLVGAGHESGPSGMAGAGRPLIVLKHILDAGQVGVCTLVVGRGTL